MYCQLCIWFIDGLCCDNVDSFIFVDDVVMCQVMIIVVCIYIKVGVVGYNRMYFNGVNGVCFQQVILLFVQQCVVWNQNVCGIWFQYIFCCYMIQNVVMQWFFYVVIFDNWGYQDIFVCIIVIFGYYQILCDVNQMMGQIIGVCGFQCGICQIFMCIVCGDEVLEYVQIFMEVCGDWCFDDGVIWFCYQIMYICQLMNLCCRIMCIGVGYYIDVVEGDLLFFLVVMVNYGFGLQVIYYCFRYMIVCCSLDIDNFVIVFVSGYQIRLELFLDFSNFGFCFRDDFVFFFWDDYVININGCI